MTTSHRSAPSELGVLIPAHRDGERARDAVRLVAAAAGLMDVPVTIVVADNGGNDGFAGGLLQDARVHVVEVPRLGPGNARTAASQLLVQSWRQRAVPLDSAWVVSLDADVSLGPDFLTQWATTIASSDADILCAPSRFDALSGEVPLVEDARVATAWVWNHTALFEHFAGVVNIPGCNHAVRASTCEANDHYLQPVDTRSGVVRVVAGDDWDFGLRARLRGFSVERVPGPDCLTSARRITCDPAGFLTGRIYEGPFQSVTEMESRPEWPPAEDWSALADRGRTRIAAHFLLKPWLAGLEPRPSLRWFLGDSLFEGIRAMAPVMPADPADWVEFRTKLVARLFEPEVFELAQQAARRLCGVPA